MFERTGRIDMTSPSPARGPRTRPEEIAMVNCLNGEVDSVLPADPEAPPRAWQAAYPAPDLAVRVSGSACGHRDDHAAHDTSRSSPSGTRGDDELPTVQLYALAGRRGSVLICRDGC